LAAKKGEEPESDPKGWYRQKFGEEPKYGQLLDNLASTPAERRNLLRPYFEPTPEESEQDFKVPTVAHKAIAALSKMGYIRMILTTNFDRLTEIALNNERIVPDIISSEEHLEGGIPYTHSKCYVVKLHGDYLDPRIKNTPEELVSRQLSSVG
jgi:NAD-dependent SIR2 family protein deacetylase